MAKALTTKALENIRPGPARREIPDGYMPGLYFIVQPSGARSWAVRYRHQGTPRKLTLGSYPKLKLAAARERASEVLRAAQQGRDPAREKRDAKRADMPESDTVPAIVELYLKRHIRPHCPRSAVETERLLRREICSAWAGKSIHEISRRDIIELADSIVDRGAPVMANRTLGTLRRMFNWCIGRGILETSPLAGIKAPAAENSRDRVLDDAEVGWFWRATEGFAYPFQPFFRLLLLTGQRRSEVAGMRWSELDLDNALWTLPRERSKNDRAHEVPLSKSALTILRTIPRLAGSDLVFTTTGSTPISGWSRAKRRLDGLMLAAARAGQSKAHIPPWRLHDLRRTAASGMARLRHPVHVVEAVLNHRSGTISGIAAIYNRYSYMEERGNALQEWGALLEDLTRNQRPSEQSFSTEHETQESAF